MFINRAPTTNFLGLKLSRIGTFGVCIFLVTVFLAIFSHIRCMFTNPGSVPKIDPPFRIKDTNLEEIEFEMNSEPPV